MLNCNACDTCFPSLVGPSKVDTSLLASASTSAASCSCLSKSTCRNSVVFHHAILRSHSIKHHSGPRCLECRPGVAVMHVGSRRRRLGVHHDMDISDIDGFVVRYSSACMREVRQTSNTLHRKRAASLQVHTCRGRHCHEIDKFLPTIQCRSKTRQTCSCFIEQCYKTGEFIRLWS